MTWQCSALRPDGRPRAPRRRPLRRLRDADPRRPDVAGRRRRGRPARLTDGDVIRMRKLLLQPSSSSAGDAGAQDAIGEAIREAGGDLGDAAS